ncbi:MotE family protein [Natribacillus halophilus]|uniref:Flagellar motility protein MotE, a chaperone for MotC folding n=1 Tax=Natribacillus halophilus TaxID=549003 RepID=A0A1G8PN63_9BACI|nr:hypothetical protein [Natribacillus halophilus]SDI93907.1 Flagellar motility protein MotE, a chaperone for MotC folding [Natribacillus halophilus]
MAKKSKRKENGLPMFLFLIVIPAAVLVVLGGVLLSLLGMNPMEQVRSAAGQLPVVSTWITAEDDDEVGENEGSLMENDDEIMRLEQALQQAEETIEELEEEIEQMEEDEAFAQSGEDMAEEDEAPEELARIARVYENMNPRRAAEIMEELSDDVVLLHMSEMNDDSRSDILQNMDPERAADITTLLGG